MTMFMDRHYVEGATSHAVALAHDADLGVQDKYGMRFLTYWFDEERSTAFCLVESPDEETIRRAHDEAHGLVPNLIMPVDPGVVASFLGRVIDPAPAQPPAVDPHDSAFRAIMFTDLKDSTLMTSRLGDAKALHLLHIHDAVVRSAIRAQGGREVKHTGDGLMVSFPGIDTAVECAVAVQEGLAEHNHRAPDEELQVRIGVHAGEPIEERGDLFGSAVQLAARLCSAAAPGEILVSELVRQGWSGTGLELIDRGPLTLKGLPGQTRAYRVTSSPNPAPEDGR